MSAVDIYHSHTMKNPGHQINAQLFAATFRTSFTAKKNSHTDIVTVWKLEIVINESCA